VLGHVVTLSRSSQTATRILEMSGECMVDAATQANNPKCKTVAGRGVHRAGGIAANHSMLRMQARRRGLKGSRTSAGG
jgi:hypothetical protein